MNYLAFIFVLLFCLGITDFFLPQDKKLHKQIFYFTFILTYILFTIKYYYGPDITLYVSVYDNISPISDIEGVVSYNDYFEPAFLILSSLFKTIGVSFWLFTAFISSFLFFSLFKVFSLIKYKRTFALMLYVILDFNLITFELRQSIAVSFYLLMVLNIGNKRFFKAMICCLMSILMHKSSFLVSIPTIIILGERVNCKIIKQRGLILLGVLLFMVLFPIGSIITNLLYHIPLPANVEDSIRFHFTLGKSIQSVLIIYLSAFICLIFYTPKINNGLSNTVCKVALFGLFLISILYPYYFLLNRLRSYFLPFFIVFILNLLYDSDDGKSFVRKMCYFRQIVVLLIVLCMIVKIGSFRKESKSHILDTSTIFSLIDNNSNDVQKEQLNKAAMFWKTEFLKNDKAGNE